MKISEKQREFSDGQKAQIFERDRATCVYSGKSLWALDYGACPLVEWDWVDHIKPLRRGGRATLDNGVCASYTFNSKKRANGADSFMLLDPELCGTPSENHFYYFGPISDALHTQLVRLAAIESRDWYFNRAVCHLLLACDHSHHRPGYKRTPTKWQKSALKKLEEFRKLGGTADEIEKRKLLLHPKREDVRLLLSFIEPINKTEFGQRMRRLKEIYRSNARAMSAFWNQSTVSAMRAQMQRAKRNPDVTPAVLDTLQTHLRFWENDPRE